MTEAAIEPDKLPSYLRKPRLLRTEAAEYLERVHGIEVAVATLAKYASVGGGPRYNKLPSRTVLYPRGELDAWAVDRLGDPVGNTAEAASQRQLPREQVGRP